MHSSPFGESVTGNLWSHMVSIDSAVAGIDAVNVPEFSNTYTSGNAWAGWGLSSYPTKYGGWKWYCPECPMAVSDIVYETVNPGVQVVKKDEASSPGPKLGPGAMDFIDSVYAGEVIRVGAGEHPSTLERRRDQFVDAVGVDQEGVIRWLSWRNGKSAVPNVSADAIATDATLTGNVGMALSGTEAMLFVFGGTDNGGPEGGPLKTARRVSLTTGEVTAISVNGEEPGHVEAATYRFNDRTVYFVQRGSNRLYLRRWEAMRNFPDGGAIRTQATFPESWTGYTKVWIGVSPDGRIVVTLGAGSEVRMALFDVDAGAPGMLRYFGSHLQSEPMAREPIPTDAGIAVFPLRERPSLESVLWDAFAVDPADKPEMH